MNEYFLGQVITTVFGFVPRYFRSCNGQLLRINDHKNLFSVIGVRYGGDGTTTTSRPVIKGDVFPMF
jgi:microcystin-dependent protein